MRLKTQEGVAIMKAIFGFLSTIGIFVLPFILLYMKFSNIELSYSELKYIFVLFVLFFVIGFFSALFKLSNDPPYVAIVTIRGKKTKKIKKEGYRLFFFWFPFFHSFIPINVGTRNLDCHFILQHPSKDTVKVPLSINWRPDKSRLIDYINRGKELGITNILKDAVQASARNILISKDIAVISSLGKEISDEIAKSRTLESTSHDDLIKNGGGKDNLNLGIIIEEVLIGDIETSGKATIAINQQFEEKYQKDRDIEDSKTHGKKVLAILKSLGIKSSQVTDFQKIKLFELVMYFKAVKEDGAKMIFVPGGDSSMASLLSQAKEILNLK